MNLLRARMQRSAEPCHVGLPRLRAFALVPADLPRLRAAALLALLLASAPACRRTPAWLPAPDASSRAAMPAPLPERAYEPPPRPVAPWCVVPLPLVSARAIDRRGHVFALAGDMLRDETAGTAPVRLPRGEPCPNAQDALTFAPDGTAAAVVRGRLYLRGRGEQPFRVTPVCTDVPGVPWSARRNGPGWAAVGRRLAGREFGLLLTDDPAGQIGWYATRALPASTAAVVLEGEHVRLVLSDGGHPWFADDEVVVAGAVLAAGDATYASLTRTAAGVAIARDVDASTREVLVGRTPQGTFQRQLRRRPPGPTTRQVFVSDYGRLVATTDRGVEWATEGGQAFVEVARWPAAAPGDVRADPGRRATFGWLDGQLPAIVTPGALVALRCPSAGMAGSATVQQSHTLGDDSRRAN